jgi:hypothetical protein
MLLRVTPGFVQYLHAIPCNFRAVNRFRQRFGFSLDGTVRGQYVIEWQLTR